MDVEVNKFRHSWNYSVLEINRYKQGHLQRCALVLHLFCVILYTMLIKHRTYKQIVIGTVFCGFWLGLGGLIYWANYTPPVADPSAAKKAQALQVVSTKVIHTSNNKADLVGVIKNPNANAGSVLFKYKFLVKRSGQTTQTINGESFILPSAQKYLISFGQDFPDDAELSLEIGSTQWNFVDSTFSPPDLVLINKISNVLPGTSVDTYQLKGLIANQSSVDYTKVVVSAIGLNDKGEIAGISNTFMGSLVSLERREFTAQWPLQKGAQIADVKVFPEVNVFSPGAVQQREGAQQDTRDVQTRSSDGN